MSMSINASIPRELGYYFPAEFAPHEATWLSWPHKEASWPGKIHTIFHFGEFARIYQSFKKFDECFKSNSIGSNAVFKFCLDNDIKLIYSATSASLGIFISFA